MSRYGGNNASGHRLQRLNADHYRMSWTVDRYYPSSRLRHPVNYQRDTDRAGAERFAKKWGCDLPSDPPPKTRTR